MNSTVFILGKNYINIWSKIGTEIFINFLSTMFGCLVLSKSLFRWLHRVVGLETFFAEGEEELQLKHDGQRNVDGVGLGGPGPLPELLDFVLEDHSPPLSFPDHFVGTVGFFPGLEKLHKIRKTPYFAS